jgi:hypothetical protein
MKKVTQRLLVLFSLMNGLPALAPAQTAPPIIKLQTGKGPENLLRSEASAGLYESALYNGRYYMLLQLDRLPNESSTKELQAAGITLGDYITQQAYLAQSNRLPDHNLLRKLGVTAIYLFTPATRTDRSVLTRSDAELEASGMVIAVSWFGDLDQNRVTETLVEYGAEPISLKYTVPHTLFVRANRATIDKMARLPFISFISAESTVDHELNYNNHAVHAVDPLSSPTLRNLQGKGVTVGIGDNANASTHIDVYNRLMVRTSTAAVNHGTHVTGIVGGAGIINPQYNGMAPAATMIGQLYSDVLTHTPVYMHDYHMVLTNNSYYAGAPGCPGSGAYNFLASYVDSQLYATPSILHVFASGNDGAYTCGTYPLSYGTIKSGFQCAKNVLTVGAIDNSTNLVATASSRGPVNDGRIKPEILTGGRAIISTIVNNQYASISGTSMSSPTATGVLALLVERYRQLHPGTDPDGALLKALISNSADDIGNTGPDYFCGFGMMNARRAVEAMEGNRYWQGTITHADSQTYTIPAVPAGAQLKVMLYWPDKPANTAAAKALVNDLDLTVLEPGASSPHQPLILNPSSVAALAQEGRDSLNNIEQVMFTSPSAGAYTIGVKGKLIPSGSQPYVITYEIISPSVSLEYPAGGEKWSPGQSEIIRWSSFGTGNNSFTLEYSLNGGTSWNNIVSNLPAGTVNYTWALPADSASEHARVRITTSGPAYTSASQDFTLLGQAALLTLTNPCPGYAALSWNKIKHAQDYEVWLYTGSDTLKSMGTTIDTSFLVPGLRPSQQYYVAVQARFASGTPARRSVAAPIIPSGGTCTGTLFDNDYALDSLLSPVTGRANTLSQPGTVPIQWRARNYGATVATVTDTLYYQVNGGTVVAQQISQSIPSLGSATVASSVPVNFGTPGTYTIKAWIKHPGDGQPANDTVTAVVKHLSNPPLTLSPAFTEGFESAAAQTFNANTRGFNGLDRADYTTSDANGRVRTRVDSGFARTGNRCITLDEQYLSGTASQNNLLTTYNLSNYTSTDNIWLNFFVKNHGVNFNAANNKVWIRGNDQAAWVPVYTLPTNITMIGMYQPSPVFNIREKLADSGQVISSSFQVRFGQEGYTSANAVYPTGAGDDGYSFDDLSLTKTAYDIALVQISQPTMQGQCNLGASEPITFKIRNYTPGAISNVSVGIKINNTVINEIIPSLPAGDHTYSFSATADLSAFQRYQITAWVNTTGDDFHSNDTIKDVVFHTTPYVTNFPYLEGFESNNGYWYAEGINSSWAWGAPSKDVINRAANGNNAWVTNLTGPYNSNEYSFLYSPCFNLSAMSAPMISFSHIVQMEQACLCDISYVEYSYNDTTWTKLGVAGGGTNWYDNASVQAWQIGYSKWHTASYDIPTAAPKIRFRFVLLSDPASNFAGMGIDDVHIYDKMAIYADSSLRNGITQNISGTNWIDFNANGKRVLSIHPNGQNLGATTLKTYLYPGAVRYVGSQYYLNRNMVIRSANAPTGPVKLRFYFLETEVKDLMNATGCANCTTIEDAFKSGITQYSGIQTEEDDTFSNNYSGGTYHFWQPGTQVTTVPYNNGYYAEFSVNSFSEFWLNGGGPNENMPLPLTLRAFTAVRVEDKGQLNWATENEINTSHFNVEKSINGRDFYTLGTVKSAIPPGAVNYYSFTDNQLVQGTNYYRLKMVDQNGLFSYSQVKTLRYDKEGNDVIIYPNPVSEGKVFIRTSVVCNKIELRDITGRLISTQNTSGWLNTFALTGVSKGVYTLDVFTDTGKYTEKLIVE